MGRLRASVATASPVLLSLVLAGCIGAEPTLIPYDGGGGDGAQQSKKDGGVPGDATTGDAKGDVTKQEGGHDAGIDTGHDTGIDVTSHTDASETGPVSEAATDAPHDAGVDAPHDAGVDAPPVCPATLDSGGPPGSIDLNFANGPKSSASPAGPGKPLVDASGNIYVIGTRLNCVSGSSQDDFAITRFTPAGALDPTFNMTGTLCIDFDGGNDVATAGAFDGSGNIVMVGMATNAAPVGDASLAASSALAIARIHPTGAIDVSFGTMGKVRPLLQTLPSGACTMGASCAPPEAQEAEAIAFDATHTHFFVAGTTQVFPGGQGYFNAAFLAAFNSDGTLDTNFNMAEAHPNSKFASQGYITDDSLTGFFDVAVDDLNVVVAGTDQGAAVDGGFAGKARQFVTRRYVALRGVLDPTFNSMGPTPGEIRTALGTNDYALALRVDPLTHSVTVVGPTSVGGVQTQAGIFAPGFMGAVRYTATGVPDITFGNNGVFVSTVLQGFPAYEHFLAEIQCDQRVLLGGFVGSPSGVPIKQAIAVLRLTPRGAVDTTYGAADAGGITSAVFAGENVIDSDLTLDLNQDLVVVSGDQSGNPILERFLH